MNKNVFRIALVVLVAALLVEVGYLIHTSPMAQNNRLANQLTDRVTSLSNRACSVGLPQCQQVQQLMTLMIKNAKEDGTGQSLRVLSQTIDSIENEIGPSLQHLESVVRSIGRVR